MIRLVAAVVAALSLGGTFALINLGLVLVFRATQTFNFAHGQFMLLAAFIVADFQLRNTSLLVALTVSMAVTASVGSLFYVLVLRRVTGLPLFMAIFATLGYASILNAVMNLLFRKSQYEISIPALPSGRTTIFGAQVSTRSLVLMLFTFVLAGLVVAVMRFTRIGVIVRAAGQDATLASQRGIPISRVYLGSWAVASALAAVAGISYGTVGVVSVSLVDLGLAAIPAMVVGGIDSVEGAVVGGVIVGFVEIFAQVYIGGEYSRVITYGLLLIALLFIPQGLFGTREAVRL